MMLQRVEVLTLDSSAYYEYACKQAGIRVAYCAEQFENDGSPTATIERQAGHGGRVQPRAVGRRLGGTQASKRR